MVTMSVLHASVSGSVETKKVRMMLPEVASGDSKLIPSSVQCEAINPIDGKSRPDIGSVTNRPHYDPICVFR